MEEILLLANKEKLEDVVWQDSTNCTVEDINKEIKYMARQLQELYLDLEQEKGISVEKHYILGDVVNLISNLKYVEL